MYFNDVEHFNSKTDSKEQFEKITIGEFGKALKTDKNGLLIGEGDSFNSTDKDTFKNSIKIVAEICKDDDCQTETMNIRYLD